MPNAAEEAELIKVIRRYVTPDRRYLKLGSALLGMTKRERAKFTRKLGQAASEVTPRELGILLDGGWRERKTAGWLITVARRTDYRERLGELLLASEGPYAGQSYCVALTTFGTPADADLLRPTWTGICCGLTIYYDQGPAIGALLLLDTKLGADQVLRLLTARHHVSSPAFGSTLVPWPGCSASLECSSIR